MCGRRGSRHDQSAQHLELVALLGEARFKLEQALLHLPVAHLRGLSVPEEIAADKRAGNGPEEREFAADGAAQQQADERTGKNGPHGCLPESHGPMMPTLYARVRNPR